MADDGRLASMSQLDSINKSGWPCVVTKYPIVVSVRRTVRTTWPTTIGTQKTVSIGRAIGLQTSDAHTHTQ